MIWIRPPRKVIQLMISGRVLRSDKNVISLGRLFNMYRRYPVERHRLIMFEGGTSEGENGFDLSTKTFMPLD